MQGKVEEGQKQLEGETILYIYEILIKEKVVALLVEAQN